MNKQGTLEEYIMALPLIPTVLIIGAFFGLIGGGFIFWATHNFKAVAITAASIFSVALLYLALYILRYGV